MVYRLTWIAGIGAIALALGRVSRLLQPAESGLSWQVVVIVAAILGGAVTAAAKARRTPGWAIAAIDLVAMALLVVRIAAPETTRWLLPTSASPGAIGEQLALARDAIRSGVAPVPPVDGIIAILAAVFWLLGALLVWGLRSDRPYAAVLTPLVVYLEFAVMDRRAAGWWTTGFMVAIGLALMAVAVDRRGAATGRLNGGSRRLLVRTLPAIGVVTLTVTLATALVAVSAATPLVPRNGYLDWRYTGGLTGDYFGSVSYNPFVGIRQQLISPTNVPVFLATVSGDLHPEEIYWRLITLDTFDGEQWSVGKDAKVLAPEDLKSYEPSGHAFAGEVGTVLADITIHGLVMDWMPAPYAPVAVSSANDAVEHGFRVKGDDASLRYAPITYQGMSYTVRSQVPRPEVDALARRPDGALSTIFAEAVAANRLDLDPTPRLVTTRPAPDREIYLELPETVGPDLRWLAYSITQDLETEFERALALESFFRDGAAFAYSTDVETGHGAVDLEAWLLDPSSPNYRTGYCEQFATALAVMARAVGIPSRVVLGFTPGTLLEDGRLLVRDRNAHAWVEMWMGGQGWVRFDSTPRADGAGFGTGESLGLDLSTLAPDIDAVPQPNGDDPAPPIAGDLGEGGTATDTTPEEAPVGQASPGPASVWLDLALAGIALALALVLVVPGAKWLRRRRRLARLGAGDITAAWHEIVDRMADLGHGPTPATTPMEFARGIGRAVEPLATLYGAVEYGPSRDADAGMVALAVRSLDGAEETLAARFSPWRRLTARLRPASLLRRRRNG